MFINYLLFINFEHYSLVEHDYKGRIIVKVVRLKY